MARPTLVNGNIWTASLANASIRPQVGTVDEPGFFSPLDDLGLTDLPGNLKENFYSWFDRLRLTNTTGLQLNYQGCKVRIPGGAILLLTPGSVFLPDNATGFIFLVATLGTVSIQAGSTLPLECLPIYNYVTLNGSISILEDAREQEIAVISPQALPENKSPFSPGDIKETFRTVAEIGWAFAQGQPLDKTLYPELFNAIGYTYGGNGNTFLLPNMDKVYPVADNGRAIGDRFGSDQISMSISNMPSHTHATQEAEHVHGFASIAHNHTVKDPTHGHANIDRGHNHRVYNDASRTTSPISTTSGAEVSAEGDGAALFTAKENANITITPNATGITLDESQSLGAVRPATTNISISANGGGVPVSTVPKSIVIRYLIKL